MKKKIKIAVALLIVLAIIILLTLWLTNCFTQNRLTSKLYRPDNVYEEIWNLVVSEQFGATVLTTSTEEAYEKYNLGGFEHIGIPEYNMSISWEYQPYKMLLIYFCNVGGEYAGFLYDYETNTLYGEADYEYFAEHFLQHYLEWNKEETKYSLDNLGNANFKRVESLFNLE